MAKLPFMLWYPEDWIKDTRALSAAAKGVWMDLINFMWLAPQRGIYRKPIDLAARETGLSVEDLRPILTELNNSKVASVSFGPRFVTVVSRRIVREEKKREFERIRKARQRRPAFVPGQSGKRHAGEAIDHTPYTPQAVPGSSKSPAKKSWHYPELPESEQITPEEMAKLRDKHLKPKREVQKEESAK